MPTEADWRRAYHQQVADAVTDYKAKRDGPRIPLRVQIPGTWRSKSVHSLTNDEIDSVARREAELDLNRAIHSMRQRAA